MGGSKLQLYAIGPQDFHLTANPQITFYKKVYRRHTNFSIENKQIFFTDTPTFGEEYIAKIQYEGDLLGNLYLEVDISGTVTSSNTGSYTVNHFAYSLLKNVEILIGGISIEKQYGIWMLIYDELTNNTSANKNRENMSSSNGGRFTYDTLNFNCSSGKFNHLHGENYISMEQRTIGNCPLVFGGGINGNSTYTTNDGTFKKKMYIPLKLFFTKSPGLYLPLCALYSHEIQLKFNFETAANLQGTSNITNLTLSSMKLYGEFILLDEEEKNKFKQSTHEYVIEQVQLNNDSFVNTGTTVNSDNANILELPVQELNFSHPIKYFTWCVVNEGTPLDNSGMGPCYLSSLCFNNLYGNDGSGGLMSLRFNGEDRENKIFMSYFTRYLISKYCKYNIDNDRIGIYSFALNPFENEPSGTCNFSRIKTSELNISIANNDINNIKNKKMYIFGVNYNIFLINDGMAMIRYK